MHEGHEGGLSYYKDKPSWIVFTEEVGHDPKDVSGKDFSQWANIGYWPIVRINNGYGSTGTIPLKQYYSDFAVRVKNYVRASMGVVYYWIIGNEPNLAGEWPESQKISPEDYVACFKMCRTAIKSMAGHRGDIVIPASIAPWNVDSGDWIAYFKRVMTLLEPDSCDGIALHTYAHGSDSSLILSDAKMNVPYQDRYYNFKAYRDFMEAIPLSMRSLPVLITECDQNDPWDNKPNNWIQSAYGEIEQWNQIVGTQKIQCLTMYRFPQHDKWFMVGKNNVLADFTRSVDSGFISPEPRTFMPEQPILKGIVTTILLNVRDKADVTGKLVGSRTKDNVVDVLETSAGGSWYRIGQDQWVSSAWVELLDKDDFNKCLTFILKWEGLYSDNPADPGGATMKGITLGTYAKWWAAHGQGIPGKDDLKNISDKEVSDIYYNNYWLASGADKMLWPMNLAHFNLAVNGGVGRAQKALAASGIDFWKYMVWCRDWYRSLSNFNVFGNGWINRCKDLILTAYE